MSHSVLNHVVYTFQNLIEKMENLEHLRNLQFMTLSFNRLKKIEGISNLRKLIFLDLSYNYIIQLNTGVCVCVCVCVCMHVCLYMPKVIIV